MSGFVINLLLSILFFVLIPIGHYWVFIKGPKEAEEEERKMRSGKNRKL